MDIAGRFEESLLANSSPPTSPIRGAATLDRPGSQVGRLVGPSELGELVSINPSVVLLSVAARNSAPETFTSKPLQRWGRRCTGRSRRRRGRVEPFLSDGAVTVSSCSDRWMVVYRVWQKFDSRVA